MRISDWSSDVCSSDLRVLGKMRTERKQFRACLDNEAACTAAGLRSWREVARATRGKPEIEVLKTVNGYFNRWPYKIDRELYGVKIGRASCRERVCQYV